MPPQILPESLPILPGRPAPAGARLRHPGPGRPAGPLPEVRGTAAM